LGSKAPAAGHYENVAMKLALLQLDPTVGAVEANARRLLDAATRAGAAGADLCVAPELCVVGYPPRDLLDRPAFVSEALRAQERVVREAPGAMTLVFGAIGEHDTGPGARLGNEAIVARGGRVLARARKRLLPTYDVFDEARHFAPGRATSRFEVAGCRVVVTVCEDAWGETPELLGRYEENPLAGVGPESTDLVINVSASPFTLPKLRERERVFAGVARRHRVPVALANQVGGNDELVFDGRSTLWGADGRVLARAAAFREDHVIASLDEGGPIAAEPESDEHAAYEALVLGVRDYAKKCGFRSAVLGLSGGIDSALVATIAADALGRDAVLGVSMPTRYSSEGSKADSIALAHALGIRHEIIDIDPIFTGYLRELEPLLDRLGPAGPGDVTFENLQARIRGATVMAISNRTGALVLTTGNKSEIAVGYTTLYGDMVGGLAVISDLPKTFVYRLARWLNRSEPRIPRSSIEKPPSAELRPNQTDQDSLPPYELLDRIVEAYVERGASRDEIVRELGQADTVDRVLGMIQKSEYKRRQAAPGIIITRKAFGMGRRIPIAQGFVER
jgi:NAD+ synthetase